MGHGRELNPLNPKFFDSCLRGAVIKHTLLESFRELQFIILIVPTPLVGEGTIYSNGFFFFLFSEFWPIDIFVVEKCEWYH